MVGGYGRGIAHPNFSSDGPNSYSGKPVGDLAKPEPLRENARFETRGFSEGGSRFRRENQDEERPRNSGGAYGSAFSTVQPGRDRGGASNENATNSNGSFFKAPGNFSSANSFSNDGGGSNRQGFGGSVSDRGERYGGTRNDNDNFGDNRSSGLGFGGQQRSATSAFSQPASAFNVSGDSDRGVGGGQRDHARAEGGRNYGDRSFFRGSENRGFGNDSREGRGVDARGSSFRAFASDNSSGARIEEGGGFGRDGKQGFGGGGFGRDGKQGFGGDEGGFGRGFRRGGDEGGFGGNDGSGSGGREGGERRAFRGEGERNSGFGGGRNAGGFGVDEGSALTTDFGASKVATYVPVDRDLEEIYREDAANAESTMAGDLDLPVEVTGVPNHLANRRLENWEDSGFERLLLKNLEKCKYRLPRRIQSAVIPLITDGWDLFGHAETGGGKTAAFVLPIIDHIMKNRLGGSEYRCSPIALTVAPTRELVGQLFDQARKLVAGTGVSVAKAYGQYKVTENYREINEGCNLLFATPGRLSDFIKRGYIKVDKVRFFVLDEADRLLDDQSFQGEMMSLCDAEAFPPKENRQTLLFSATLTEQVQKFAEQMLKKKYAIASNGKKTAANKHVEQSFIQVKSSAEKMNLLSKLLLDEQKEKGSIDKTLVFVQKKTATDMAAIHLTNFEVPACSINGDRSQEQRERALKDFRQGKIRVLVATDVCARGIDIGDLNHVINVDLPIASDHLTYVHRIGRTGRLRPGRATTFVDVTNTNDRNMAPHLIDAVVGAEQTPPPFLLSMANANRGRDDYGDGGFGGGGGHGGGFAAGGGGGGGGGCGGFASGKGGGFASGGGRGSENFGGGGSSGGGFGVGGNRGSSFGSGSGGGFSGGSGFGGRGNIGGNSSSDFGAGGNGGNRGSFRGRDNDGDSAEFRGGRSGDDSGGGSRGNGSGFGHDKGFADVGRGSVGGGGFGGSRQGRVGAEGGYGSDRFGKGNGGSSSRDNDNGGGGWN